MRLIIKTLQQAQFPVNVNPDETVRGQLTCHDGDDFGNEQVAQLKERISQMAESRNVAVERQKLIHAGKVLEDGQALSETAVKEGDFVVLMTVTPKSQSKPAAAATSSSASVSQNVPTETTTTASATTTTAEPKEAESRLVTGDAYDEAINRLVDMGFERESVVAAMRASFNNPERAVEYLTSGTIPDVMMEEVGEGASAGDGQQESTGTRNAGVLEFLRNDPQFQQLRTLIQQNPQMLGPIIEQLGQSSPEMIQLIGQNREEFLSLITEGTSAEELGITIGGEEGDEEEGEGEEADEEDAAALMGGEGHPEGLLSRIPANAQILQVTEEERQAIGRLESMGFDRARVVEAFFACDKNEELAANYLLEHLNDD